MGTLGERLMMKRAPVVYRGLEGEGTPELGIYNSTCAVWLLDFNGNFICEGPWTDKLVSWSSPGDMPVVGKW